MADDLGEEILNKQTFFTAVRLGSDEKNALEAVKRAIQTGAVSVDELTPGGNTALGIAAMKGDQEMAGLLLSEGANPNHPVTISGRKQKISPLELAVMRGDEETAASLLSSNATFENALREKLERIDKTGAVNQKEFNAQGVEFGLDVDSARAILTSARKLAATVADGRTNYLDEAARAAEAIRAHSSDALTSSSVSAIQDSRIRQV